MGLMLKINGKGPTILNQVATWPKSEWIFDNSYNAWYYLKEDGLYATGTS